MKIIGMGDNVVDKYLDTRLMYPGGNSLNICVYAKQMGVDTGYIGIFGDDMAGKHVYDTADEIGIDLSHSRRVHGENGYSCVTLKDGDRIFVESNKGGISATTPIGLTDADYDYLKGADIVHSSCFSYTELYLKECKRRGIKISYDFSNRFSDEYIKDISPSVYCACLSCSHMTYEETRELMNRISELGPYIIIATRGEDGALVMVGKRYYEQSPCLVKAKDTMGAGDSFITGFLVSYVEGMKYTADFPEVDGSSGIVASAEYEDTLVRVSLHRGAVCAARTCTRDGSFGYPLKF